MLNFASLLMHLNCCTVQRRTNTYMCVIISVSPSKTLLVTAHTASVMKLSVLTHQITHRRGSSNSTERYFCDFLVNGHSLLEMLDKLSGSKDGQPSDLIGSFVVGYPEHNQQKRDQLLLAAQPDTESGRIMLYICPECGDLGCGAYTVRVEKTGNHYTWNDFAYENGYEPPHLIANTAFTFDAAAYEQAMQDMTLIR